MLKNKKVIGGICAVVAVAVAATYIVSNRNSAEQMLVSTESLQRMDLRNTVSLTGVVETETGRKVYSTLSYPVEAVNVEVGDVVQEGDVLAKLKTSDLELDIAQQQAAVNANKNQSAHQIEVNRKAYENAKENYENDLNANALSAQQGVTQAENSLEQSNYNVESAKLQLKNAKAAVQDAKENYILTRDQLEGSVTTAERLLRDAEDALSEAQAAYNSAVAGQADAEAQAAAALATEQKKFEEAQKDWDTFQMIHKQDYDDAKADWEEKAQAYKKAEDEYNQSIPEGSEEGSPELKEKMNKAKTDATNAEQTFQKQKQVRASAKSEYDLAEMKHEQAKKSYEETMSAIASSAGAAQSGVISAQSGVSAAEAQLDAAKDARNGATLAQIEQGIDSAKRGVEGAEIQKDVAKSQQEAAEQSAELAKQQEEAAKTSIEQQIDNLKDSLIGSQISAQSTQSQEIAIQKLQNTLEDATITAPVSGVVTAVYAKVGEPGNGLLFVVEDTESLKITTRIKEYDIANVKEGMPVIIKSDATGDKEIAGTITYIAPAAVKTDGGSTKTTDSNSTVEFEAEVQVNEKNSGLRIGMNTRLTVLLEEKEDVFGVPYDSVVEKADGSEVVYAVNPKDTEGKDTKSYVVTEVPVTTGLETDFYIEVSGNGITEGMAVLSDPQSVAPGMEVTPDFLAQGTASPVIGLSENEEE